MHRIGDVFVDHVGFDFMEKFEKIIIAFVSFITAIICVLALYGVYRMGWTDGYEAGCNNTEIRMPVKRIINE